MMMTVVDPVTGWMTANLVVVVGRRREGLAVVVAAAGVVAVVVVVVAAKKGATLAFGMRPSGQLDIHCLEKPSALLLYSQVHRADSCCPNSQPASKKTATVNK